MRHLSPSALNTPAEKPGLVGLSSQVRPLVAMREGVRFVDDILMNGDGMKDITGEDYPWPMPHHPDEAVSGAIPELFMQ
jgi:choline dehydrogenase